MALLLATRKMLENLVAAMITLLFLVNQPCLSLYCDTSSKIELPGAGSSIATGFINDVAASYTANRSLTVGVQVSISQEQTNSGAGMERLLGTRHPESDSSPFNVIWANGETFFPFDLNPRPGDVYQIPILAEGFVIFYNLPDFNGTLNLTSNILAAIYMGQITLWNDTQITRINQASRLPDAPIVTIARKDAGSGNTRIITSYLAKSNAEWNTRYSEFVSPNFTGPKGNEVSQNWPKGAIDYFANAAFGMMDLVLTISNSIGYGPYNDAIMGKISFARLSNQYGKFVTCTPETMLEATNYFVNSRVNETSFRMYDAQSPGAWPITTLHYIGISMNTMGNFTCCQRREFVGFMDFILFMPQNANRAVANYFASLVSTALPMRVAKNILSLIECDGENMYDSYRQSLVPAFQLLYVDVVPYQTALIVVGAIILLFISGLAAYLWHQTALMHERNWLIPSRCINLAALVAGQGQSLSSFQTSGSSKAISGSGSGESGIKSGKHCANVVSLQFPNPCTTMEDKQVMVVSIDAPLPRHWRKDTKALVFRLCQRMTHPSVAHLFGVTVVGTRVFAVEEYLAKGSLHCAIGATRFELTESIKISIAGDIAEGVAYLHSKGIVHGLLNSLTCFVSLSWTIKVADWMISCVLANESKTSVDNLYKFSKEDLKDERRLIQLLYLHPGAAKACKFTQQSDVFSFGMLLYEILNRCTPYTQEVTIDKKTSFPQIIKTKIDLQIVNAPEVVSAQTSLSLEKLAKECLMEKQTNFFNIMTELQSEQYHGSITDILMESMEGMITDLEKKTADLKKISVRMRELLNQVLPATIAEKLAAGQTVEPEYFESVSVFFSDIVGFTTISSQSSPLEVMTFLNDLWIAFDAVIELHDCYKVDTIGDAYMVCSGLPTRNGILHVKHIADLALALLRKSAGFVIRHMLGETLKIRIGLHTGPVTAGVVGTKMPQYCVFGDTVNTANRMESTGMPGRIQVSDITAKLLNASFPQYVLVRRGEIDVKGKGQMSTYWLEDTSGLGNNAAPKQQVGKAPLIAAETPFEVINATKT